MSIGMVGLLKMELEEKRKKKESSNFSKLVKPKILKKKNSFSDKYGFPTESISFRDLAK